jgi:phosphoglucosamine mutase
VRGIANKDLSAKLAFKLGQAGARFICADKSKGRIVIGRDTRVSGDMLESALVAGMCSRGVDVLKAGIMPTPAVAFLVRELKADGGVVISASHNPAEYNGIKFFDRSGLKLSDDQEDEIEVLTRADLSDSPAGAEIGVIRDIDDAEERYIDHVVSTISGDLEGFSVAIDCANGAAYRVSPAILRELGVEVLPVNVNPDGLNINAGCGSVHPECIGEIVKTHNVDLGLTHDGDADRVIAIDENGEIVDGDFIMAICAAHLKDQGELVANTIVTTLMTNLGFDLAMRSKGIKVVKTKVGDRYVLEEMLKGGYKIGGEQSGHIIFLDHNTTGDGIVTALQLMAAMRDTRRKLSELKRIMTRLPQILVNVKIKHKERLKDAKIVWEAVRTAESELADKGRILVRPSGTEPLMRVMVEAETQARADEIAHRLADVVKKELS